LRGGGDEFESSCAELTNHLRQPQQHEEDIIILDPLTQLESEAHLGLDVCSTVRDDREYQEGQRVATDDEFSRLQIEDSLLSHARDHGSNDQWPPQEQHASPEANPPDPESHEVLSAEQGPGDLPESDFAKIDDFAACRDMQAEDLDWVDIQEDENPAQGNHSTRLPHGDSPPSTNTPSLIVGQRRSPRIPYHSQAYRSLKAKIGKSVKPYKSYKDKQRKDPDAEEERRRRRAKVDTEREKKLRRDPAYNELRKSQHRKQYREKQVKSGRTIKLKLPDEHAFKLVARGDAKLDDKVFSDPVGPDDARVEEKEHLEEPIGDGGTFLSENGRRQQTDVGTGEDGVPSITDDQPLASNLMGPQQDLNLLAVSDSAVPPQQRSAEYVERYYGQSFYLPPGQPLLTAPDRPLQALSVPLNQYDGYVFSAPDNRPPLMGPSESPWQQAPHAQMSDAILEASTFRSQQRLDIPSNIALRIPQSQIPMMQVPIQLPLAFPSGSTVLPDSRPGNVESSQVIDDTNDFGYDSSMDWNGTRRDSVG
jgi:hypothetical protein